MLAPARAPGQFTAECDKCRSKTLLAAPTEDAARAELGACGWMEAAQRGRHRKDWLWWCPACKPKPAGFGRTTP